jgi:hypothetical protein
MVAVNGDVTGDNSVAVTGTAAGANSLGVLGQGDLQGVRGHGAVGVRGEGASWNGVEGVSQSTSGGYGVFGVNTAGGTGVAGTSAKWVGVYGETAGVENGPAGVWGEHKGAGIGVKAVSKNGVALVAVTVDSSGKAATFQGQVDVIGQLNLNGVNIVAEFTSLLQRIVALEQKVATLSAGGSGGGGGSAFISAGIDFENGLKVLHIWGNGFQAAELVRLQITTKIDNQNPFTESRQTTADSHGFIDFIFSGSGGGLCAPPQISTFTVKGTGLSSSKNSNVVQAGC